MLKFKNSYELISHLMKEKLLTGFYLSSGGANSGQSCSGTWASFYASIIEFNIVP